MGVTQDYIALAAALRAGAMLWVIADAVFRPAPVWLYSSLGGRGGPAKPVRGSRPERCGRGLSGILCVRP